MCFLIAAANLHALISRAVTLERPQGTEFVNYGPERITLLSDFHIPNEKINQKQKNDLIRALRGFSHLIIIVEDIINTCLILPQLEKEEPELFKKLAACINKLNVRCQQSQYIKAQFLPGLQQQLQKNGLKTINIEFASENLFKALFNLKLYHTTEELISLYTTDDLICDLFTTDEILNILLIYLKIVYRPLIQHLQKALHQNSSLTSLSPRAYVNFYNKVLDHPFLSKVLNFSEQTEMLEKLKTKESDINIKVVEEKLEAAVASLQYLKFPIVFYGLKQTFNGLNAAEDSRDDLFDALLIRQIELNKKKKHIVVCAGAVHSENIENFLIKELGYQKIKDEGKTYTEIMPTSSSSWDKILDWAAAKIQSSLQKDVITATLSNGLTITIKPLNIQDYFSSLLPQKTIVPAVEIRTFLEHQKTKK